MMYYQSCDAITMVTVGTDKTLQKVSAVVNTAETYVFMYAQVFFRRPGKKLSTARARQVPRAVI
jgi:hypothetical protein